MCSLPRRHPAPLIYNASGLGVGTNTPAGIPTASQSAADQARSGPSRLQHQRPPPVSLVSPKRTTPVERPPTVTFQAMWHSGEATNRFLESLQTGLARVLSSSALQSHASCRPSTTLSRAVRTDGPSARRRLASPPHDRRSQTPQRPPTVPSPRPRPNANYPLRRSPSISSTTTPPRADQRLRSRKSSSTQRHLIGTKTSGP